MCSHYQPGDVVKIKRPTEIGLYKWSPYVVQEFIMEKQGKEFVIEEVKEVSKMKYAYKLLNVESPWVVESEFDLVRPKIDEEFISVMFER